MEILETHVSFLEIALSTHSRQPNPGLPDGPGRLPENLEAVGSWRCRAKFSVCEERWNFFQILQTKQVNNQSTCLCLQNIGDISSSAPPPIHLTLWGAVPSCPLYVSAYVYVFVCRSVCRI